jgi:hypothetical protein
MVQLARAAGHNWVRRVGPGGAERRGHRAAAALTRHRRTPAAWLPQTGTAVRGSPRPRGPVPGGQHRSRDSTPRHAQRPPTERVPSACPRPQVASERLRSLALQALPVAKDWGRRSGFHVKLNGCQGRARSRDLFRARPPARAHRSGRRHAEQRPPRRLLRVNQARPPGAKPPDLLGAEDSPIQRARAARSEPLFHVKQAAGRGLQDQVPRLRRRPGGSARASQGSRSSERR